jgi:predicted acyl esterase
MSTCIILEKNVEMPLRDGTVTRANVYQPEADAPVPAILVRTPYSKDLLFAQTFSLDPVRAAESGFAVVFQDTRGRYESDGDFHPYRYEAEDGYDSVEWVARQDCLAEGVVRARYRDGYNRPSLIKPGEVYVYEIDLVATSNVFRPGHRIRVDVTSSSFPYLDRNSNTGNPLGEDGPEDLQPAVQTVFHDVARPFHLVLPIIPR